MLPLFRIECEGPARLHSPHMSDPSEGMLEGYTRDYTIAMR